MRASVLVGLAVIASGCMAGRPDPAAAAEDDPSHAIISIAALHDVHPSVGIDSGWVFVNLPDVGPPAAFEFMSEPPPYWNDTPEQTILVYSESVTWIDWVAQDSATVRIRQICNDPYPICPHMKQEGVEYSRDQIFASFRLLYRDGPSFIPNGRRNHWAGFNLRWRQRQGPWYEVLFNERDAVYLWMKVTDNEMAAYTWQELFSRGVVRQWLREPDPTVPGCETEEAVEASWDIYENPLAPICFTQPIRAAPSDTSAALAPAWSPRECPMTVLSFRGEWLEVANTLETCDSYVKADPQPNGAPLFERGWIRWHEGPDLTAGHNYPLEEDGIRF